MVYYSPDGRLCLQGCECGCNEAKYGKYDHPKDAFPIDGFDPLFFDLGIHVGLQRVWLLHGVLDLKQQLRRCCISSVDDSGYFLACFP